MGRMLLPPSRMVFGVIVMSRPSQSENSAWQRGAGSPSTSMRTWKLKVVNGTVSGMRSSGQVHRDLCGRGLDELHPQELQRPRRRDAELDNKAAEIEALRRVERL